VFHFNKKHLEDETIPMWVLKLRGETFYVNHVDCSVPWSTKETPDNAHTKGAIKVKHCHVTIDNDNCATIRPLTDDEKQKQTKPEIVRVITENGSKLKAALQNMTHGPIKMAGGGCGTTWYIVDIPSKKHFTILQLQIPYIRQLMPNEDYYKQYDQASADSDWLYDDDDFDYEDLYEE
jgi:hypothetical protein